MGMNIRQLSYFISVGEMLSFTRAAKKHYIAQTSMSEQIQEIERQLDTKLLLRSKRAVSLTPAGKTFLIEARRVVALFEESVRKTRLAASGIEGSLKVGFLGPNERAFLPQLIRDFRRNWPNIELSLTQGYPKVLRESLIDGLLDCAFTTTLDPYPYTANGFNVQSIYCSPVRAVM
jgi:DNA-binding transcriptional LysR family regulator